MLETGIYAVGTAHDHRDDKGKHSDHESTLQYQLAMIQGWVSRIRKTKRGFCCHIPSYGGYRCNASDTAGTFEK